MSTETKIATPAYTTYTSFTNLINDLRENDIPSHITRSVVKGSVSGKSIMIASLKYLNLISKDSTPTQELVQLVENEDNYNENLNKLLHAKYQFLFDDSIDIKNTTSEKVAEKFEAVGASGSTVSKCMAFFLTAAKAAGIEVSHRVKAPKIKRSPKKANNKKTPIQELGDQGTGEEDTIPEGMERITVPLRNMDDGIIFFPEDLDKEAAKRAIKMTEFILKEYYEIDED
jgi:uncharacterized protein DUF5343